jgi:hypothetical protein
LRGPGTPAGTILSQPDCSHRNENLRKGGFGSKQHIEAAMQSDNFFFGGHVTVTVKQNELEIEQGGD